MRNNRIWILVLGFMSVGLVNAQSNDSGKGKNTDNAYNEKVVVTAPYQPTLGAVNKMNLVPQTADTFLSRARIDYQIISRPFQTTYPTENIKPAKIMGEPIPKLQNNSIRLGVGYPLSPLAELNFGVGRNREWEIAAYYKYHQTFGSIKDYSSFNTNHSLHDFDLRGSLFGKKFNTSLNLSYDQKSYNCYGLSDADTLLLPSGLELGEYRDFSRRWYQNARGVLTFTDNAVDPEDWRFDAKVDYNLNLTAWKSIANDVTIDGGVSKMLMQNRKSVDMLVLGGRITFVDNAYRDGIKDGYFEWNGEQLGDYKQGNELLNAYHLSLQPTLYYRYGMVELNAALVFHVFGNDPWKIYSVTMSPKQDKFQFNPVIDLKLHIIENAFTFFLGTDGGVWRNSMASISDINPYLHPLYFSHMEFTREKFTAYAGLSGNFSRNIDYKLKASARFMENMLSFDYYKYDYTEGHTVSKYGYNDFIPIYSGPMFNLNVRGDLNFRWGEKIIAHVDATYNYYSKEMYYAPAFTGNIAFKYRIVDQLEVYTGFRAYSSMKALDRAGNLQTINKKGVYDWNIGAEYRFLKFMTAFVDFNNILAQRTYTWYDYPTYRFGCMAGVTFNF